MLIILIIPIEWLNIIKETRTENIFLIDVIIATLLGPNIFKCIKIKTLPKNPNTKFNIQLTWNSLYAINASRLS